MIVVIVSDRLDNGFDLLKMRYSTTVLIRGVNRQALICDFLTADDKYHRLRSVQIGQKRQIEQIEQIEQ